MVYDRHTVRELNRSSETMPRSARACLVVLAGVLLGVLPLLPAVAVAGDEDLRGRVVQVLDGDSIVVLWEGRPTVVRLHGIDAPEGRQPFGRRARRFTAARASGRVVTVRVLGRDRHDRLLGEVVLPDGASLNRELVREGLAWWFRRFSSDAGLGALEAAARRARRGLWAQDDPVPPWEWRDAHRTPGASPPEPAPIVGNRRSGIYHRSECPDYGGVAANHRVAFRSAEEAEQAGYRLARNCPRR